MRNELFFTVIGFAVPSLCCAIGPCYEEPGSRAMTCIDATHVRSNGNLRASKIFMGGPNGVEARSWQLIADCALKVAVLQDERGVNFGAGAFDSTPAMKELGPDICEVKKTRPDTKLRQF